jgi:adenylyl-sulfate kinase
VTRALVLWFTGLSGAGKSTVADGVYALLKERGYRALILDGDTVRARMHRHLGFTESEIKENNRLIVELCVENRARYDVILVPIISPYAISRHDARERIVPGFYEIYLDADLATVTERDIKGLYAKGRNGTLSNLIGVSPETPYEAPTTTDLILHTGQEEAATSVRRLYGFVRNKLTHPGNSDTAAP